MNRFVILSLLILPILFGCTSQSASVQTIGSTVYITKDTGLYDKPNGKAFRDDINKGRVTTLIESGSDWSKVLIYTYDTPMDNMGWVPNYAITNAPSGLILTEGRTCSEEYLFDAPPPKGKKLSDKVGPHTPVRIETKGSQWIYGSFPGGLTGWIPETGVEYVGPSRQ